MKKLAFLLALATAFSAFAVGCGSKPAANSNLTGSLEEIMTKVYEGVDVEIMVQTSEITEEDSDYHLRMPRSDYEEALISQSAIGSQAHSVVLVRTKPDTDMEAFKKALLKNADLPQKWICVEAEKVLVDN
ncbi:MAG: hypothetical protein RSF90_06755, partial [Pygmaiobacter sp.]